MSRPALTAPALDSPAALVCRALQQARSIDSGAVRNLPDPDPNMPAALAARALALAALQFVTSTLSEPGRRRAAARQPDH